MSENLKKFLEFIGKDSGLWEKAKQLKVDDPEKAKEIAIAFAKENGFELTEADFEAPEGELSENELCAVAGGETCVCVVGGGGKADKGTGQITCACVLGGGGEYKDYYGDKYMRCVCVGAGTGENAG